MGRYNYLWRCEFYTNGGWLKRVFIDAKTRDEAIEKLHKEYNVIETLCVVRAFAW